MVYTNVGLKFITKLHGKYWAVQVQTRIRDEQIF
jgi:hypothetical protein